MSDTSTLFDAFKVNYGPDSEAFQEQQNLEAKSWKRFSVSPMKPTPKGVQLVVTMTGNESGGAMNENEAFNDPDSLNPVTPLITVRQVGWPFKVTGRAIALSETDKQSFGTATDMQMKDNLGRILSDLNRQALGKGTGQMTLANGAGIAVTALVVDNAITFRRGMKIESFVTIGGAKEIGVGGDCTVTAVDIPNKTLTISPAQTWSDNSVIVKKGVQNGAPVGGKELTGVQAICDTNVFSATFEGVSTVTNPEWVGTVVDGLNSPISQDLLQRALDQGEIIGRATPDLLISNKMQRRVFLNSELQKTRYQPEEVKAGNDVLSWNTLEWQWDKDYDIGEVGMYDTKCIEKFQTDEPHLSELDGKKFSRTTGKDEISGYYIYYGNLGTWKRNKNIRLINLVEPTF